jgi:hypothetical protein
MTSPLRHLGLPCLLAALHAAAFAAGEGSTAIRDPMQAPAAHAAARPDPAVVTAPTESPDALVRHLMVIDGRRFVIEGGQRLGVGDRLGDARIERIDDGAVWLRDARGVRQVSLFGGIAKRPALDGDAASSAASTTLRANVRIATRTTVTATKTPTPQALAAVPTAAHTAAHTLHPDRPGSHPTR